jgi:hypothetical protein
MQRISCAIVRFELFDGKVDGRAAHCALPYAELWVRTLISSDDHGAGVDDFVLSGVRNMRAEERLYSFTS